MIRILGGKFKGKKLNNFKLESLRPTKAIADTGLAVNSLKLTGNFIVIIFVVLSSCRSVLLSTPS